MDDIASCMQQHATGSRIDYYIVTLIENSLHIFPVGLYSI
jgi:hypothetical protein